MADMLELVRSQFADREIPVIRKRVHVDRRHLVTPVDRLNGQGNSAPTEVGSRIATGTSAFLVAGLLQQGLVFALLPFLTRAVTPAEFGRITVATTAAGLAAIVMGLGLEAPVFRLWFARAEQPAVRNRYLATARTLLGISSISIAMVLALAAWLLPVDSEAWSPSLISIAGAGGVAAVFVSTYVLPLLRAQDRLRAYLTVQLTSAILQPLLLGSFVLLLGWGAVGWITAAATAHWIAAVVGGRKAPSTGRAAALDRPARRELLSFGLPLVPHGLSHWALAGVDRLVLVGFVSSASVGVYGLAYRIAQLVSIVVTELNRAMMNEYGRLVALDQSADERARRLGGLAEVQIAASVAIAFVLAVLAPPTFRLLFPPEYGSGAAILPWVALGYAFFGMYYVPTNILVLVEGRSRWLWTGTSSGAAVNLAANLVLIPRMGIVGAAQATAIGYATMLIVVSTYALRVTSVRPRIRIGKTLTFVLASAVSGAAITVFPLPGAAGWVVPIAASLAVSGLAALVAWQALHVSHAPQGTQPR